jgi:hypothetical protein
MIAKRSWIAALALLAGLACSATVQAQPNGNAWGYRRNQGASQAAYDNGYRQGFDRGVSDARSRRYDYRRHGEYRRYGNQRDDYGRAFQDGFVAGYDAGFYGRNGGSWRNGGGVGRYPTYPSYPRYPSYPPYPSYPTRPSYPNDPAYPGYGGYGYNEAYDRGHREGLDKGRDDGHDNDRYDPRGEKWYREGDRGYKREYGPREQYKAAYREGFVRGYEEGYRGADYNRGGWRW